MLSRKCDNDSRIHNKIIIISDINKDKIYENRMLRCIRGKTTT